MHSIPATVDFAGIDNAGLMRISVAHTYAPEPEPEPAWDGLVVDLSTAVDDWDGRRMLGKDGQTLALKPFPAGDPLTGASQALEDDAQYLPLETPIPMQADGGPATEFSIIGLYWSTFANRYSERIGLLW